MIRTRPLLSLLLLGLALLSGAQTSALGAAAPTISLDRLLAEFVPNQGQWDGDTRFTAWKGDVSTVLRRDAILLSRADGPRVALRFSDARPAVLIGEGRTAARYNFALGTDASAWRSGVRGYRSVRYRGLYDGIDVRVRDARGALEYDVLVAAGADLARFGVAVEGARRLSVAPDGSLRLETQLGTLRQHAPVAWDVLPDGTRRYVDARFVVRGSSYGFAVRGHDTRNALVVDPGVDWATFVGGAGDETVAGLELARDGSGDIVITGQTASPDFPRTRGNLVPVGWTPYVARLNAAGTSLLYSTFFGGTFNHSVQDVALDSQSRPLVVGDTNSLDFPTTEGAYDRTPGNGMNGDYDAYAIKFEADGSGPIFGTYLAGAAGTGIDQAWRAVFDAADRPIVTGITSSPSFPTTAGAYDRVFSSGVTAQTQDVFLTRFTADGGGAGDLRYSTFLGGDQYREAVTGIGIDPNDPASVTVVGWTYSGDFPTTPGALLRTHYAPVDTSMAFATRFRFPAGGANTLQWSTFFGAPGNQHANDVAIDSAGRPIFVGGTATTNPPTTDRAYDRVPGIGNYVGNGDGYVARLSADGARNEYTTLLGGGNNDETVQHVAYVGGNSVVVGGLTDSPDFPVTPGAYDTVYGHDGLPSGGSAPGTTTDDGFVARVTLEEQSTDTTPPAAPQLKGPLVGATFTAHVLSSTFDWTDVADESGIRAYQLQISPNSTFSHTLDNVTKWWEPWTPTSIAVKDFSISQTGGYWWRVRALDNAGNLGPWSDVWTFTVNDPAPPAAPTLASPPNGGRFAPGNIVFDWNPAARAKYYEIQVDTSSSFSNANRIWLRGITATRQTISVTNQRTHWWRVRGTNDSLSAGPWSTVRSFEIRSGSPPAPVPPPDNDPAPGGGSTAPSGTALAPFTQTELPLTGAQSGTLTVNLNGPAPAGGALVRIASNYPDAVSAPASVTVPAGATSANITVTASNRVTMKQVTISASYGPGQDYGVLVTSYAGQASPDLHGMSVNGAQVSSSTNTQAMTSFGGGETVTGVVSFLPGWTAPPGGGRVKLGSTDPLLVQVPDEVVIPAGTSSANFTVTTRPVSEVTRVTVLASRSMTHRVVVELLPAGALETMSLNPTTVIGGQTSSGTVTLASPAPAGGVQVALTSSDTRWATVPASVTVPGGATSAGFTVTTNANNSGEGQSAVITASAGGISRQQFLNVHPPGPATPGSLSTFTLNPTTVVGGNPSTATVTLAVAAGTGGVRVDIFPRSSLVTTPPFVTVPQGQTSTTFTVNTQPITGLDQFANIVVGTSNSSREAQLRITQAPGAPSAPNLSSLSLDPSTVAGGSASTGTVVLTAPAQAGGFSVALSSSDTSTATVPGSVTIPEGASSGTFQVSTTSGTTTRTAVVSAADGAVSRTATLTVEAAATPAPTVSAVSLSPSSVAGGTASTGTVTISAPAPAAGLVVSLSSSNTAAATVPASVTVAAGSTSRTFQVSTTTGTTTRTAVITASAGGVSQSASLTVQASSTQTGTVTISRAEWNSGRLRIEATGSPAGTLTAYVTSTDQLIGTLSSGRLEVNWPSNPGSVTVRSTNGGQATRTVSG